VHAMHGYSLARTQRSTATTKRAGRIFPCKSIFIF
jgi:hypothetical protein